MVADALASPAAVRRPLAPVPLGAGADCGAAPDAGRTLSATLVEMILPEQTNHYGTLFGGEGLSLLAKAAFVTASRYTRANVVMAGAEGVRFVAPVPPGALLELTGTVTRQGRSSLTVRVEGTAETPQTGARQPVMQADFEMVAVDGSGRPVAI